jgi:CysZ protein
VNPALGLKAFSDGFRHSRHASLRHYVWLPALISLAVIGAGLYFALGYLTDLARGLIAGLPDWLSWLEGVLTPLLYLLGVLFSTWLFALLAVLIASPFLGAYSLAVERLCFGSAPVSETVPKPGCGPTWATASVGSCASSATICRVWCWCFW